MQTWALVVGINVYPEGSGQQTLNGAVADAAEFADWALHRDGGMVAPERLHFWTHPAPTAPSLALAACLATPTPWIRLEGPPAAPEPGRAPTFDEVTLTALNAADAALASSEQTRLYVFFAGHGVQTTSIDSWNEPQTCFVTADYRQAQRATRGLVPCDDLRRGLLAQGFGQVVMFLDCCRSPMRIDATAPSLGFPRSSGPTAPLYGVGRAAQMGALAFEAPKDSPTRGAFSQVLVDGLRRYRDPDHNNLTLNALESYVSSAIGELVAPEVQYPQFDIQPRNPPFELLRGPPIDDPDLPVRITFSSVPFGTVFILRDYAARPLREIVASSTPVEASVRAGSLYSLETTDGRITKSFEHTGPGATHVEL
jgi:hypothetical protein